MHNCWNRREWMAAATCWQQVWAAAQQPPPRFRSFTEPEAAEIAALAETILPEDDGTPGAKTAGVIRFIDAALAGHDEHKRPLYRTGLQQVQQQRRALFPDSSSIAALLTDQRIALLRAVEDTPFFSQLRRHTVMGFVCHPTYGGNRDQVGWKHIGFEPKMHHHHPFGAYEQEPE